MMDHILIGLDGSSLAETITPYIIALSKRLGASTEVTLLHVLHVPENLHMSASTAPRLETALQQATINARAYLDRVQQQFRDQGVQVSGAVVAGDAPEEIVRYASQHGISLIALATHGRFGLRPSGYGSVAEKVLYTSATPVLMVHPVPTQAAPGEELRRIIVPLDGSALAEGALPMASTLANSFRIPLTLVRVVEDLYFYSATDDAVGLRTTSLDTLFEGLRETAEDYLTRVVAGLPATLAEVETAALVGSPAATIAEYAQTHPGSMVVLTAQGRGGPTPSTLGSVARRVVQLSGVPTLVVRPSGAQGQ